MMGLDQLMLALIWRPAAPPIYIFAGAGALAALAIIVHARTFSIRPAVSIFLLVMRLGLVIALAALLMGPSEIPAQIHQKIRPKLCVMLDTSQSMLTGDCGEASRMRFAQTHWLNEEKLQALSSDFELQLMGFDSQVRPLARSSLSKDEAAVASGNATHLAECLTQALLKMPRDAKGQAMLLISDGHDSNDQSIQPAAVVAKSKGVPIHTVCLGGNTLQRDLAVLAVPMQEYLLAGEPGEILVKVYQVGLDRAASSVQIECGSNRSTMPVEFAGQRMVELRVPIKHDQAGQYEYSVKVNALQGEVETNNNEQRVFCDVTRQRIAVLMLEGQPYWDTKFLAQSLRKDERIELTQITQLSSYKQETISTRVKDETRERGVPKTADEFAKFDVVILGSALERMLTPATAALLKDFVARHGGHVIFARGVAYDANSPEGQQCADALAELEPVIWGQRRLSDLALSLTASGRNSPWFSTAKMGLNVDQALARLPGFRSMPEVEQEKPAAVVLMRARPMGTPALRAGSDSRFEEQGYRGDDGAPALVTMTYGRGTVVGVLGEGLWQWSLLEKDRRDLAGFYDAFWSNLVRWLAMGGDFQPGQQVSLKLNRSSANLGETITIDVVFRMAPDRGSQPVVIVTDPGGNAESILLSRLPGRDPRFRATYNALSAGVHRVVLNTPGLEPHQQERGFSVNDVSLERLETSADPMAMRVLAEHTGGETFKAHEADRLIQKLRRKMLASVIPTDPQYVWDKGQILFFLLLWAGLEWIIRRKAGLL